MNDILTNAPEYSVSDLAGALKRTLEDAFGQVRLRGEISGYRGPHSSGHCYFAIKDQNAKIDAVIWKGVFGRLKFRPEEGLEIIATGRITTFPGKSTYQIVVESIEPAGVGALMALLEERRRKLTAEGLFEEARKQLLPYLPRVIGIVTSPTGAVIRDMIHRLSDRFPRQVILWPVRVQGEGSAEEIASAIRGFNLLEPGGAIARPDVLIVARGGGSLEDLWSFNEEIVIRAAAESEIPLVSAIGHETDWTLLDLVADIRAPTPTAAAEMVVPVRADLLLQLRDRAARLSGSTIRCCERAKREFSGLIRALPNAQRLVESPRQRLDLALLRQANARGSLISARSLVVAGLARRLSVHKPEARLARVRERLRGISERLPKLASARQSAAQDAVQRLADRLARAMNGRVTLARRDLTEGRVRFEGLNHRLRQAPPRVVARKLEGLSKLVQLLDAFSYEQVLARGFALVRDAQNQPIRARSVAEQHARLVIQFADGRVDVAPLAPTRPDAGKSVAKTVKPATKVSGGQGNLF
ncbi:XseA Exonuclease VII, large subunit [Rhabdaerophilaceae bacterium]